MIEVARKRCQSQRAQLAVAEVLSKLLIIFVVGISVREPCAEQLGSTPSDQVRKIPLQTRGMGAKTTLFQSLPSSETGLDFMPQFPQEAPFRLLTDQAAGCGICIGDFDLDGNPDVYLTHYDRGNRLYRNMGDWRFVDVTDQAGVGGKGRWCAGAVFTDIDNDGDLDLFVCAFNAPNLLYINEGQGRFRERARDHGLDFSGASVMMTFADYDLDGDMDGYLVTHRLNTGRMAKLPKSSKEAFQRGLIQVNPQRQASIGPRYRELFEMMSKGPGRVELFIAGQRDYLYRNDGSGRFTVVNDPAGITGNHIGLAATWWDYNEDGFPDLYVSNDYRGPDQLWHNNGNGTFRDVANTALPYLPWSSMGSDHGDIDNDGHTDFFAADMRGSTAARRKISLDDMRKDKWFLEFARPRQSRRNMLYRNTGTGRFMEIAHLTGLAATDWTWTPKFGDYDNDGRIDLFIANGMTRDFMNLDASTTGPSARDDHWQSTPIHKERNFVFRNLGDYQFSDVSRSWGLNHLGVSFAAATGDMDRDGDLDLLVTHFDEPLSVYENRSQTGHAILVRLHGTKSNRWGIGSRIILKTRSNLQAQQLVSTRGFISANEPIVHFGLGTEDDIDNLTVHWPSGQIQILNHLEVDHLYEITESPSTVKPVDRPLGDKPAIPWFRRISLSEKIVHVERPYDDFESQPLLPKRLSRLGPGMAWGDIDGDGDDDLYLGGAAGDAGKLYRHDQNHELHKVNVQIFAEDNEYEDMAPLFFDADGDSDLDLFVVSGGVEYPPNDERLRDRLYWNIGQDGFIRADEGVLPDLRDAGSVVAASDFDRDGDLDLFIGARVVPGAYPLSASSRLLRNEQGRFIDVTHEAAKPLEKTGMVTSALWTDVDGNGWPDLLLTVEWGSIRFLRNDRGVFKDETVSSGLAQRTGWWNGIQGRDLDGDGDIDYVTTNLGWNTPYQPTVSRPEVLFYGTFPELRDPRILEAFHEDNQLSFRRGRTCILRAMPNLVPRFPSYGSFARSSVRDTFDETVLSKLSRYEVNTSASCVLMNQGKDGFSFHPLPRIAQTAPAHGVILVDFNADGLTDICLAQNFYHAQPEIGPLAGGVGQLLSNQGGGQFDPIPAKVSGLSVWQDARSLSVTDLNDDGWPDLFFGVNDGEIAAFENAGSHLNHMLNVHLQGSQGNPTAIGAYVTFTLWDGTRQSAEIYAGGGYLSQNTSTLTFGMGAIPAGGRIAVRWPDGRTSNTVVAPGQNMVSLVQGEFPKE